ncbi:putative periplasmic serine endoprotease DegP-like [Methylocella tundrae]|uniref:Probable periplasmic serine endoprotease DegP-like n=1 Tax=Methylocella tundrae TaxID=227605 RepID=A0A8B6M217_METTU|nr:Do family serine endopeptidase [Methylocella tundrae]VTZ22349.1 putative periplasmic serine endoprotease DegP-like [Methylocella tundrae]VTZ49061.1 putative periplasmic serine endoprotease DegP-like [Methylocella tundrae]
MALPLLPGPDQTGAPHNAPRRPQGLRLALLGAVATVALTGALANSFISTQPAIAETSAQAAPAASPVSFADVVDHVRDAVVSVKVKITETADASDSESDDDSDAPSSPVPHLAPGDPLERFFKRFGEQGAPHQFGPARPHTAQAQGSGFIISSDGYVVTNNHVVEKATDVTLTTDEGKTLHAKVVGTDKKTDLALLKITEPGTYPHVNFAGATPRVGDWVIAVGNPFGLGGTVTAGIVSARGRDIGAGPYDDFLQIDAPVNRGNSGGPTFNTQGDVVGVNTAIFSPSGGSVGIGFAIPAETAQSIIATLKDKGSVARGWIGVQIQPVTDEIADSLGLKSSKGALVADAQDNSPAKEAGIKSGDVILGVNGERVDGPRDLAKKVAALGPGKKADLLYWHDGSEKTVAVKLGSLPDDSKAGSKPAALADNSALTGLGLKLAPASSIQGAGSDGVVIADINPDGVAAQKGLRVGDVILEAGGHAVSKPSDISSVIADAKKDGRKAVLLRVKSGEGTRFVAIATNPAS